MRSAASETAMQACSLTVSLSSNPKSNAMRRAALRLMPSASMKLSTPQCSMTARVKSKPPMGGVRVNPRRLVFPCRAIAMS